MNIESLRLLFRPIRSPQFFKYAAIGFTINGIGYCVYLALTHLGTTPKLTMTVLYSSAVLIGFLANRRYTFQHSGHLGSAAFRYLLAYFAGYLLNLSLLLLFVDLLGFAHQIVQAVAIFVVAIFLFVLSRVFVFAPEHSVNKAVSP